MSQVVATILLLGAIQGVVLAVVLVLRRANHLANRLLAGLVLAMAGFLAEGYLVVSGIVWDHPHLLALDQPLPFAFGPLLLLYVQSLTSSIEGLRPRHLLHGLPFLLDIVFMAVAFYGADGADKIAYMEQIVAGNYPTEIMVTAAAKILSGVVYVGVTLVVLARYRSKAREFFSSKETSHLGWLQTLVTMHGVVWLLVLGLYLFRAADTSFGLELDAPVGLASAVIIFVIAYMGLWQPELFSSARIMRRCLEGEPQRATPPVASRATTTSEPSPTTEDPEEPKYQRNRLDDDELSDIVASLEALMHEQRPHLDGDLTLQDLADTLGVAPHHLSQVINRRTGSNFYHFVNEHRIEEAKRLLADPAHDHQTILAIAHASGFNAKSTFNTFFKRQVGTTPSAYRASRHG